MDWSVALPRRAIGGSTMAMPGIEDLAVIELLLARH